MLWILVADAARARFLSTRDRADVWVEVQDLLNPDARLKESELVSDSPGKHSDGAAGSRPGGPHSSGYEPQQSHKARATEKFAREVVGALERGRQEKAYTKLVLVAPPRFLGVLRQQLSKDVSAMVVEEAAKSLVSERPDAIKGHLETFA